MPADFFPSSFFGWFFASFVIAFAFAAAWFDARTLTIPKWLTYPMAILGLLANALRAAWVGSQSGTELWIFDRSSLGLGLADGLCFAAFGLMTGFGIMFFMWILRACGGGDVKLLAALGAWLGPIVVIRVLGVSIPILFLVVIGKTTLGGGRNVTTAAERTSGHEANHPDKSTKRKLPQMRIAYSLPIAISLLIVLTWQFRVELGIAI